MTLAAFLQTHGAVIRVALTRVRGSSPREAGTEMFVAGEALYGSIGGGQLEHRAIEAARAMLRDGALSREMDVPLGPEIGQCCGGRVELSLQRMRASDTGAALRRDYLARIAAAGLVAIEVLKDSGFGEMVESFVPAEMRAEAAARGIDARAVARTIRSVTVRARKPAARR